MVKGLDLFRQHFADYADQYVLIGGTAATLAMEDAGLDFRATKDLDIVLHVEALNAAFGATFWTFVEQGRYEI
jgi:formylmethanofuran dehydrogenase subunit E